MNLEEMIERQNNHKETKWEAFKWEINYFFSNIHTNIRSVLEGIGNFWRFRSEIYNWRWWDHAFLHNTLKARLQDMHNHWDESHYVDSEKEKEKLKDLLDILDEIERKEDECSIDSDKEIDDLYQKFGRTMFDINEYIEEHEGKTYIKRHSQFRRFWD